MPAAASRAWITHQVGRAVLVQCVEVLAPHHIPVLLLKGLWLQRFVYGPAGPRSITDVDVLVPQGRYAEARAALLAAGWQQRTADASEASYVAPGLPLPIDLHAKLYTRGAFHVGLEAMFERAAVDSQSFGCTVLLPDPIDVISHLIGHALKSGSSWGGWGTELGDIAKIVEVYDPDPRRCAERLQADGLDRAARFVLSRLAMRDDAGRFASAVVACLDRDGTGEALAQVAHTLHRLTHGNPRVGTGIGFVLDSSLWRGGYALALRVCERYCDVVDVVDAADGCD